MEKSKMGLESERCLQDSVKESLMLNDMYLKIKERKDIMDNEFIQKITVDYRKDKLEIDTELGNAEDLVTAFMTIMTFLGYTANIIDDVFNEDYSMLCKRDENND
jgi:hypothetical protein